ncbi:Maf family protein [Ovoidimarina sediminis]|uniref:Maf family protein n=1 Tax=Ovoidimarina sediminis TaxID=3079856 RepID=UPI002908BE64|nr:Maf family protein [Rhodophyticola sp. MJ-SS7]MDU8945840.1 Maf family protein [Rhodophyticola sp. MJ-SS7]
MARPRLILGSGSPRRLELLGQLGLTPVDIISPDIDETPGKGEQPRPYCLRMAQEKARAIPAGPEDVVLSADTTVALGRRILGKPEGRGEARAFLEMMSGRRHSVITAISVRHGERQVDRDNVTAVRMKRLSDAEIEGYLDTGDWQGKAGGYAIQGPAAAFIPWIQGSYSGVMGLPLAETAALLRSTGVLP